jgi:hypothetical protein
MSARRGAGTGRTRKRARFIEATSDSYRTIEGFTGKDVRATDVKEAAFPTLIEPVDDLPPATMITSVQKVKGAVLVLGVSQDNGEVASVTVNGQTAKINSSHAGVVDWEISLTLNKTSKKQLLALAMDRAGNSEKTGHTVALINR